MHFIFSNVVHVIWNITSLRSMIGLSYLSNDQPWDKEGNIWTRNKQPVGNKIIIIKIKVKNIDVYLLWFDIVVFVDIIFSLYCNWT